MVTTIESAVGERRHLESFPTAILVVTLSSLVMPPVESSRTAASTPKLRESRIGMGEFQPWPLVLTDISSLTAGVAEPDHGQSLVRLMLYANEFEIEGLIATSNEIEPANPTFL
jgi:hypothetical protein